MTMNTVGRPVAIRALDAATLCEAFQITAATDPQRVALRTVGDAVVVTWNSMPSGCGAPLPGWPPSACAAATRSP